MHRALVMLCWMLMLFAQTAGAVDVAMNAQQTLRYQRLTAQFRCVVCENQSIATSGAGLAADLRHQVAHQIVAGRSDKQIKQYMVRRYGEWILYDPPFQWSTWLLWCGPFLILMAGLLMVWLLMRRGGERTARFSLDRERLASILDEDPTRSGHEERVDHG